ncbi:cupin [Echinicola soli]|uniref:Cupin n=1 Tax=Echinicola soli TaxID=2591634 RepID=A0A514CNE4_9BACT|nr:cupin domain-containing protein [Echinicola soli]QDH81287.1 cupin [Echinicola soli]
MRQLGMQKSEVLMLVELIGYSPHAILRKIIMKKVTGNVTALSFDSGEELTEKKHLYDNFVQIIEGNAEITIDGKPKVIKSGQSIIIPAYRSSIIRANYRFKMISTVFKSGYEEVELGQ